MEKGTKEPQVLGSVLDGLLTTSQDEPNRFVLEGWDNARSSDPDLNYLLSKRTYRWGEVRLLLRHFGHRTLVEALRRMHGLDCELPVLWGVCRNVLGGESTATGVWATQLPRPHEGGEA